MGTWTPGGKEAGTQSQVETHKDGSLGSRPNGKVKDGVHE